MAEKPKNKWKTVLAVILILLAGATAGGVYAMETYYGIPVRSMVAEWIGFGPEKLGNEELSTEMIAEAENAEHTSSGTEEEMTEETETEEPADPRTLLPYYALEDEQTVILPEENLRQTSTEASDGSSSEKSTETVPQPEPEYHSASMIIIDVEKHEILAERSPYKRISPASMTKMIELLVAAEHLTESDLNRQVTVSQEAIDYSYVNKCSTAGFDKGDVVTIRELLYGTILPSGGEASYQLAVELAGSMEAFADLMNQKAEELGISETSHFTNSVGLYDENHYSTVYDMAIILEAVMDNPIAKEVITTSSYAMDPSILYPDGYTVKNDFLQKIAKKNLPGTVIAAKTGYVKESKKCAASCYQASDGRIYIAVTAGAEASDTGNQTTNCIRDHVKLYTTFAEPAEQAAETDSTETGTQTGSTETGTQTGSTQNSQQTETGSTETTGQTETGSTETN